MVQTRACGSWVLPGDPTCAGVARRLFQRVASERALDQESTDDGVTMVSELAANTLHASQRQTFPANPELWLYLRGAGPQMELVCKVFDTLPGWVRGSAPGRTVCRVPADAMSGRGLEVVHELSSGHWGHHLTRSRLSGTGIRGKAVWFALPVPAVGAATGKRHPVTARDAMTELENDLSTRGFSGRLVRADDPAADMAVLSIASGLTVWCRSAAAWLRAPGVAAQQWSFFDLVEVEEQAVQAHEMIVVAADPFLLADATRGALFPPGGMIPPVTPKSRGSPSPVAPSPGRSPGTAPSAPSTSPVVAVLGPLIWCAGA
jgi:hypothetical protein